MLDAAPAWTSKVLAPVVTSTCLIAVADPLPTSAIAISEATPMMMPRVVSTDRITLRRSERRAVTVVRAKNRR